MQNLYPLFERNRILKKELLWSLRDYSFSHVQLEYQEYGQGILRGCEIQVQGDELAVGPGMIKYGQFICLMMEEQRIHYEPSDQIQYLKIKITVDRRSADYIAYQIDLLLDQEEEKNENEFELCRFNLRSGARLRDQYKNFADMETEYDTINLIFADWSAQGGKALHPCIIRYFAEVILNSEKSQTEDSCLAYLCVNQTGAISVSVLAGYINKRTEKRFNQNTGNADFYKAICAIVEDMERGGQNGSKGMKERRHILVD